MKYVIVAITSTLLISRFVVAEDGPIDIIIPVTASVAAHDLSDRVKIQAYMEITLFYDIPISHEFLPSARAFRAVKLNKAICYLGGTAPLVEMYTGVPLIASRPISRMRWYLVTPKGALNSADISALKGKTIGMLIGLEPTRHIPDADQYHFVFASRTNLLKMLDANRLDAVIIDSDLSPQTLAKLVITEATQPLLEYDRTLNCRRDNPRTPLIIKTFERAYSLAANKRLSEAPSHYLTTRP